MGGFTKPKSVASVEVKQELFDGMNKFDTKFVSTLDKQIFDTDDQARQADESKAREMLENVHSEVILDKSKKFQKQEK